MRFKRSFSFILVIVLAFALCPVALASEIKSELDSIDAASGIVMNADTGEILFEQNADEPRAPASITKIMTSLLILEAADRGEISLSDKVTVTDDMIASVPFDASRMSIPIVSGEIFSVEELLYANMISSDCYASNVLGCFLSGTSKAFCDLMNARALELNCKDTNFTDPSGYPDPDMVTTARSMLNITIEAMKNDFFRELVSTKEHRIAATNMNPERELSNTNQLLYKDDFGAIGVKTGSSTPSGLCLVSAVERDGTTLISVIMGAHQSELSDGTSVWGQYAETVKMIEDGFDVLYYREVQSAMSEYFDDKTQLIAAASGEHDEKIEQSHKTDEEIAEKVNRSITLKRIAIIAASAVVLIILLPIFVPKKRIKRAR